ncbi:MAG: hypothetical protein GC178_18670 [Flavobacteriales bacterium]|nr:hypothetical protein [Flavobacteriales bacterium]
MDPLAIKVALEMIHPESQGWRRLFGKRLDGIGIDVVLFCKGQPPIMAVKMESTYVNRQDIQLAQHLQQVYLQRMNGRNAKVLLMYEQLLFPPYRLPKDVSVISIMEAYQEKPNSWQEPLVLN